MSVVERAVYEYLSPAGDAFWRWSDDARTLDWSTGKTMAFREEIAAIATRLAGTGLPPLGAILLFRAACRDDWKSAVAEQGNLASFLVLKKRSNPSDATAIKPLGSSESLNHLASRAFERLDGLAALPSDLRKGLPALCDLAESFFEGCDVSVPAQTAEAVAVEFAKGIVPGALAPFSGDDAFGEAVQALTAIATGAGVPQSATQRLRNQTGLDTEPKPADIAVPEAARQLIRSLAGDPELGGLAGVAQRLLAAVTLPRTLRQRQDLPVGGVSDVSNRGTLDRLLITELAHDDLTLAVRVVTQEALYLRRESPPAQPPQRRALLIDAGIRMWGVPRVYATAVALALAATADPKSEVLAFRPDDERLKEVEFTKREGLISHLAALDPAPHPGPAMPAFARMLGDVRRARTDAVIITHESVLTDPEFRRAITFDDVINLLIATVNREGKFRLYQLSQAGRRLLAEASLSLDVLLADPPRARPLLKAQTADLPVILSIHPLPLRVPHSFIATRSTGTQRHGLLMFNARGALLQWQRAGTYPRELAHNLPGGRLLGIFPDPASTLAHVVLHSTSGNVCAIPVDTQTGKHLPPLEFSRRRGMPKGAGRVGDALFVVYPGMLDAYHADTGAAMSVAGWQAFTTWVNGRFFRRDDRLYALGNEGSSLRLEFIRHLPKVAGVFERAYTDNPFFLMSDGRVLYHEPAGQGVEVERVVGAAMDPRLLASGKHVVPELVHVAADGSRITCAIENRLWRMDFFSEPPPAHWKIAGSAGDMTDWPINSGVRKHIQAIVFRDDEIFLIGKKSVARRIQFGAKEIRLVEATPPAQAKFLPFHPRPPVSRSFDLKTAKTEAGNVFLDSRGMLHFVPKDLRQPQVSLVLHDQDVAAWTSSGVTVGSAAFHPGEAVGTVAEIAEMLKAFGKEAR